MTKQFAVGFHWPINIRALARSDNSGSRKRAEVWLALSHSARRLLHLHGATAYERVPVDC